MLDLKVIPPVQLLICAGVMFLLYNYLPSLAFTFEYWLITTITLIIIASIIGFLALYDFYIHKTTFHPNTPEKTTTVVNTGIYAFSRNPMYIALVLTLFALGFYLQNISVFFMIPFFIAYITQYQIKPEERVLTELFTQEYKDYCANVRRWL